MKIKLSVLTIFLIALLSCSNQKQGEIVKDSKGNYYELNGHNALGSERYELVKIDTTKYKPVRLLPPSQIRGGLVWLGKGHDRRLCPFFLYI